MNVSDDRLLSHPPLVTGSPPDAPVDDRPDEIAGSGLDLPDLAADAALHPALEALLLVVDVPTEDEVLADALGQPVARVRAALQHLADRYTAERRGIDPRRSRGGRRFFTPRPDAPDRPRGAPHRERARPPPPPPA